LIRFCSLLQHVKPVCPCSTVQLREAVLLDACQEITLVLNRVIEINESPCSTITRRTNATQQSLLLLIAFKADITHTYAQKQTMTHSA